MSEDVATRHINLMLERTNPGSVSFTSLYRLRPQILFNMISVFAMSRREPESKRAEHVAVSLPLLAKYAGLKSVKELGIERVIVKMKEGTTIKDSEQLIREVQRAVG